MAVDFQILKEKVLTRLAREINPALTYHSAAHTAEVLSNCERIAAAEGITGEKDLLLLKIAALYHDTGFLFIYKGHEEKSCELARQELSRMLDPSSLDAISSIIMATRIPQSPKNLLEEIICDADLDYLGRDDFDTISNYLRSEYFDLGFVKSEEEWMQIQINFIGRHSYFTRTTREARQNKKIENLERLKVQAGADKLKP